MRWRASDSGQWLWSGSSGNRRSLGCSKSNAEVRSPETARCQGLIVVILMPKRFSRNIPTEVWSNTWELTQPPLLQGETTYIGTRGPMPQGRVVPLIVSSAAR
jgi:hypothetical protein